MRLAAAVVLASLAVAGGAAPAAPATDAKALLSVGDSLSVGTAPHLRERLPGYAIERVHRVGMHSGQAAARVVTRARVSLPPVLVVSAGTNDDPRDVEGFEEAIADVLRAAGPGRCVIWPTIARPQTKGTTYAGLNAALTRAAATRRNLVLVDWAAMIRSNAEWLRRDGVHPHEAGYRARAAAIARAVTARCQA